ncbi:cytochrome c [Azoarcus sp. KH32C]|uniref:cytochrome c n=1 Tax=Azoarcus sp. KH32C TaxID=748247 RepID=UPI0002386A55|nr:cytochrome c [Azoarcus sp. KH32C]BAL24317.1 hypothetical protein AZKH_2004 [Azoarcus sp. KH32C]
MLAKSILIVPFILYGTLADAAEQTTGDQPTRGALLYATHCESCHNIEIHWRDKSVVTGWTSLESEVRRWQGAAGAAWSSEDIAAVARYLNVLHYHYPAPD